MNGNEWNWLEMKGKWIKCEKRNFSSVFPIRRPFLSKGSPQNFKSNFHFNFWRSASISCDRIAADQSKSQCLVSLWRSTSIWCERIEIGSPQLQFFLVFDIRRRVAADQSNSQLNISQCTHAISVSSRIDSWISFLLRPHFNSCTEHCTMEQRGSKTKA